jgi:hypothetical protein
VAGAPKLGKTSLMLQMAFTFSKRGPGAFYSSGDGRGRPDAARDCAGDGH